MEIYKKVKCVKMTNPQPNQEELLILKLLNSQLAKTLMIITITVVGFSYSVVNAKNDLQKSISELNYKIDLQNTQIKYELKEIKTRQEADYRYLTENYVKRTELNKIK